MLTVIVLIIYTVILLYTYVVIHSNNNYHSNNNNMHYLRIQVLLTRWHYANITLN